MQTSESMQNYGKSNVIDSNIRVQILKIVALMNQNSHARRYIYSVINRFVPFFHEVYIKNKINELKW